MDTFFYHSTQKLEHLQYNLRYMLNEGRILINQCAEQVSRYLLSNPKAQYIEASIKDLMSLLLSMAGECKVYIVSNYHPQIFYDDVMKILARRVYKRDCICAGIGLTTGFVIGILVAYKKFSKLEVRSPMQAVWCSNYVGIEAVTVIHDAIVPKLCNENEVLIQVKSSSVCLVDVQICNGYGSFLRNNLSKYYGNWNGNYMIELGRQCTGVVIDIGQNVDRFGPGDEVWVARPFCAPGTLCQFISIADTYVSKKPKNVGFEGACSVPYSGCSALAALEKVNIDHENALNKRVFVHGGCSTCGCILVQILNFWGASVTTSCYEKSIPVMKALGVKDFIVYKTKEAEKNFSEVTNSLLRRELSIRELFDVIIVTTDCDLDRKQLQDFCKKNGKVIYTLPMPLKSDTFGFILASIYTLYIKMKCFLLMKFSSQWIHDFDEVPMTYETLDRLREYLEEKNICTVVDKIFQPNEIHQALTHVNSTKSIGCTVISFR